LHTTKRPPSGCERRDARSGARAISLVVDIDWPPRAATMRLRDVDGREVHSKVKGDSKK
jgi:hypothetical protein